MSRRQLTITLSGSTDATTEWKYIAYGIGSVDVSGDFDGTLHVESAINPTGEYDAIPSDPDGRIEASITAPGRALRFDKGAGCYVRFRLDGNTSGTCVAVFMQGE